METLRVGFIGAGFIAGFLGKALKSVRGVQISAVTAPEGAEALANWATKEGLGPCKVCSTVKELCDSCDAVAILAPNFARVERVGEVAEAVKAGAQLKGLICEKPLGRTVAEAEQLVKLAKEMKLPTAYFENQIHMKSIQMQKAQLAPQEAAMGPIALARSAEEHAGPHSPWFWDPTRQGGGVLSDMGCHSIAVSWYVLTPHGKPATFLKPTAVNAETALLKWGLPRWRKKLLGAQGVDYAKTPAEDFATGMVTFENPDTGQLVKAQFTNSWMYDKQGLRLMMDGLGPGYAFEVNTLLSPMTLFVGDEAAEAVADAETALEKSTASRGLLTVHPNEPDLYGYNDEFADARAAFLEGRDALLNWEYGLEVTKLVQAAYMAAEEEKTLDLTDPSVQNSLKTYTSAIAQGKGHDVLKVKK
ncbi:MAG: Gfo/Idh/MocA family protein [Candidatus Hydrogenedentota bacterium]